MVDDIMKIPMSIIEDKDAGLRDQALIVIGVMLARVGEDKMSKYISGLIETKKKKIEQAKETVKPSEYDVSEKAAKKAAKKAPAKAQ